MDLLGEQSGSPFQFLAEDGRHHGVRFVLELGPQKILATTSGFLPPDFFVREYSPFLGPAPAEISALAEVHFFADEVDVAGWEETPEVFNSTIWRLRRGGDAVFVVGTAFDPPKPYWVARGDASLACFEVAPLQENRWGPKELVLEPALRVVSRLAFMHQLFRRSTGMLMHAAGVVIGERMFLALGPSGAGKTTLSRLLLERACGEIVNDERLALARERSGDTPWTAWGTPWPGELGIARNQNAPLGALLFLEQSDRSTLQPLPAQEALARLIPLVSIPWYDAELVPRALELCERLVTEAPVYALRFRPDASAVDAVLALASK